MLRSSRKLTASFEVFPARTEVGIRKTSATIDLREVGREVS